ncbi:MAG: sulfatase-like hydrolase/transferase, partial [Proteobacteria bacterium]|nr:sulfatase-like hydrolase/transferase [Pseudomonadota bacterium]
EAAPFLSSMVEDGLHLYDHRSCSNWTYASATCLMSGTDPVEQGWVPVASESTDPVPGEWTMFGDLLDRRGYDSRMVSANQFLGPQWNLARYDRELVMMDAPAEDVVDAGLEQLDELVAGSDPWMMHLHFIDPHSDYAAPEAYGRPDELDELEWDVTTGAGLNQFRDAWPDLDDETRSMVLGVIDEIYDAEVRYMDDQIARLFDELDARGLLDEVLVVFWSDHGEQFMDHGSMAHGEGLHGEETGALAAFWGEGVAPGQSLTPTTHADVLPTLFDLMGWSPSSTFTGQTAAAVDADRPRFGYSVQKGWTLQSVDVGDRRMIYEWDGPVKLYDTVNDPDEHRPLPLDTEDAAALWSTLAPQIEMLTTMFDANPRLPTVGTTPGTDSRKQ